MTVVGRSISALDAVSTANGADLLVIVQAGVTKRATVSQVGTGATPGDAWGDPVDAVITPDADGTRDLGTTGTRFANVFFDTLTLTNALGVVSGGTGAATLTDGGVLLGSGTGAITATAVLADSEMLVGDGTTDPVLESGATLRTSVGVGTGDSPQFTAVNIGAATDTTVARVSAGVISVEGNTVFTLGGTDLIVGDGGTGASTFTDGGVLLGSGAGAITATAVLADGEFLVGDGTTDPALESGATLRTSIGVGTGDSPEFTAVNIGAATDTTVARVSAGIISVEGATVVIEGTAALDVPISINDQTGTTYTLVLTDAGKYIRMNNGSANTLTVPPNSSVAFITGTRIHVRQVGAGATTIAEGAGVTISTPETLVLAKAKATATLVKTGTDAWDLMGNLTAA